LLGEHDERVTVRDAVVHERLVISKLLSVEEQHYGARASGAGVDLRRNLLLELHNGVGGISSDPEGLVILRLDLELYGHHGLWYQAQRYTAGLVPFWFSEKEAD